MLVAQTGDLRPKADSSPSSALGAAATKPDSYHSSALGAAATKPDSSPSYGGHTKEIRAASRLEWLRAAVGEEADSFAFTARMRPASPAERPGTKSDSSPSYGRHTKEIRAASRPEWLRAAVGEEADSSPSPHECGQLRQPSGQARSQIRIIRMVATRSKVVLLRLQQITSGEAPSWSFGEASPNDREGASVAFTGGTWCASDHMKQIHVPSCAQFRHG